MASIGVNEINEFSTGILQFAIKGAGGIIDLLYIQIFTHWYKY